MKRAITLPIAVLALCAVSVYGAAAQDNSASVAAKLNIQSQLQLQTDTANDSSTNAEVEVKGEHGQQGSNENSEHDNAIEHKGEHEEKDEVHNDNKDKDEMEHDLEDSMTAEAHHSTVAAFVKELLAIADKEKGDIGVQVKAVAQEQNDSDHSVSESIEKVETRNKIKTFFFGADHKNLAVLKDEVTQIGNQIDKLKALADKVPEVSVKANLNAEIEVLKSEQARVQGFVDLHQNSFSLFGWLFS